MPINTKTTKEHWDKAWIRPPRMRLPSRLLVETRNIQRLLDRYVTPGMRLLEIGCAPGKILAWAAKVRKVDVSGIDYSEPGIHHAKRLFKTLGISGSLRCEDIFATSYAERSFDIVFSCGLVEHFNDPIRLIEIHAKMLKPGGKALITIPNYAGIYGRIQRRFDPDNLGLHNLAIMNQLSLVALAPTHLVNQVRCFPFGRLTSTLISLDRVFPRWLAWGVLICFNTIGILQPVDITALCPLLVLEMTRKEELP
jgi:2-polyprenyl-3-methyl-5-hydroxy-6-metoxy-1,4-benzoquinol methylase